MLFPVDIQPMYTAIMKAQSLHNTPYGLYSIDPPGLNILTAQTHAVLTSIDQYSVPQIIMRSHRPDDAPGCVVVLNVVPATPMSFALPADAPDQVNTITLFTGHYTSIMDSFNPDDMIARFRERAEAVQRRGIPPVEGQERQHFITQARLDYLDFAMLADAKASLNDGVLTLQIDLRASKG